MSQVLREQLSALMDGELPKDQMRFLLRGLDADARLAQSWSRYQLASAVIRRQAAFVPVDAGFADRVMLAVSQQTAPGRHGVRILRWAGGGAIAAAVAVIALVGTRPAIQSPTPAATAIAAVPATPARRPDFFSQLPMNRSVAPCVAADGMTGYSSAVSMKLMPRSSA